MGIEVGEHNRGDIFVQFVKLILLPLILLLKAPTTAPTPLQAVVKGRLPFLYFYPLHSPKPVQKGDESLLQGSNAYEHEAGE